MQQAALVKAGRAIKFSGLAFFVFGLMLALPTHAAFTTNSGSSFSDDSVNGTVGSYTWSNPSNAASSNNIYATTELSNSGHRTHYLKAKGFNFNIPASSTIDGIQVQIERKQACSSNGGCTSVVTDETVKLLKSGSVVGTNKASTTLAWPTTDLFMTYGVGDSDKWGTTWTVADINSSNFGVVLSAERNQGNDRLVSVDYISITVYYTLPDTTAPVLTVVTPVPTPTNDTTPSFTFNVNETSTIAYSFECGTTPSETNVMGNHTVTFNTFSPGQHPNCFVRATDAAGNSSLMQVPTFTVDTTGPVIDLHAPVTVEATGPSTTVTFALPTATDNIAVASVSCSPASGTLFALGATTVTCNAMDTAGNSATPTTFVVTVEDTTEPAINSHSKITVEAASASGTVVTYTSPNAVDLVDGTFAATCLPASGSLFAIGTTPVICNATDSHGNIASPTTFNVFVLDTTAPTITLLGSSPLLLNVGDVYAEAGATASDIVDGDVTANIVISGSVDTSTPGIYPINYSVSDLAGNVASSTRTVTVSDVSAPVINVISDITAEATSSAGVAVDYGVVTATDDVDGVVSTTCNHVSGSVFPITSTTVICTATDSSGHVGFGPALTITVQDTTAPDVTISPASQTLATTSLSGTEAFFTVSATDIVDGSVSLGSCSVNSGSMFSLGVTTITCTATDTHGNVGTSQATVTVNFIDIIPPVITLNGATTTNLTVGDSYVEQGAVVTDNWDTELSAIIGGSVDTSVAGTYQVTYDAHDAAGNNAVQQTRTVIVNAAPVSTGGNGGAGGMGSAFVEPTPPSFGDNPITVGGGLGSSTTVQLTFDVTNASWIAISESPDFTGVSWLPYTTSTTFTLSASNTEHKLYIKFRRVNGGETKVQEVTVLPNSPSTLIRAVLGIKITRLNELANKLKFGSRGAEVKELQTLLKQAGFFPAKQTVTGYYGPITRAAVKKYLATIK